MFFFYTHLVYCISDEKKGYKTNEGLALLIKTRTFQE